MIRGEREMNIPVVNQELANRLVQAERSFFTSRISSIGERQDNPMGVEIEHFGDASAYYIKEMPWPLFNSVKGLDDETGGELRAITEFYRAKNRTFQVDVDPYKCSSATLKALTEQGLSPREYQSILYGLPEEKVPDFTQSIKIAEVTDEGLFDTYAEIHCLASGMSLDNKVYFKSNNIGLLDRSGWKLFLAYWEGRAAAVAAMYIEDDIASCALAATLPEFRRRGLQSALLHARLHEAYKAGCQLVGAQAASGSVSQHNMERAGLRIAWTRTLWTSQA